MDIWVHFQRRTTLLDIRKHSVQVHGYPSKPLTPYYTHRNIRLHLQYFPLPAPLRTFLGGQIKDYHYVLNP
jgi:hypothetical protein